MDIMMNVEFVEEMEVHAVVNATTVSVII